ncbi:MAG TPA: 2-C-methyl-D-erythritol 4-phosphate cytidylyltransferase [Chloroflexia bacterium]|nr:2-C-methyl-D-erythritol 4-phosphate cytidylyltransferase [Chloroflexia bacterium]
MAAIIVAAGKSQRMGGADKQLRTIAGVPVLARTVAAFEACPDVGAVVLVLNPDNMAGAVEMQQEYGWSKVRMLVPGGERRQDSVLSGLKAVGEISRGGDPYEWVAVHDGARPLLTPGLISRGLEAAQEVGAAIAALPSTDTVKVVDASATITATPERANLWLAQTPQVFRTSLLLGAYESLASSGEQIDTTDCARMLELMGRPVKVFEGERTNIKITTPLDLWVAEAMLRGQSSGVGGQ